MVAFLRARLDEDEQAARAAGGRIWSVDDEGCCVLEDGVILETTGRMDAYRDADVRHVAQWDPARVLAEVEAKRRILDKLDEIERIVDAREVWSIDVDDLRRDLALPYRDHPDYDPAWTQAIAQPESAQGAQER